MNILNGVYAHRAVRGVLLLAISVVLAGCTSWTVPWSRGSTVPAAQGASGAVSAQVPATVLVSFAALQGRAWSALYVQGVGATVEPKPYIQWVQASQIAGSGGCNRFVGQAQITEQEHLRFSALASTRMACMPEPGGQEDKFFMALERTQQARLEGDDLILLDQAGMVLAQLRRVDFKTMATP